MASRPSEKYVEEGKTRKGGEAKGRQPVATKMLPLFLPVGWKLREISCFKRRKKRVEHLNPTEGEGEEKNPGWLHGGEDYRRKESLAQRGENRLPKHGLKTNGISREMRETGKNKTTLKNAKPLTYDGKEGIKRFLRRTGIETRKRIKGRGLVGAEGKQSTTG